MRWASKFFSISTLTNIRYVWEIALGAHEHFVNEETLVTLNLEDGMTCDVIGDVHGMLRLDQEKQDRY